MTNLAKQKKKYRLSYYPYKFFINENLKIIIKKSLLYNQYQCKCKKSCRETTLFTL